MIKKFFGENYIFYSFNTLPKFPEKLTFLKYWYGHERYTYQEVKNVSFSENFVKVLSEWSLFFILILLWKVSFLNNLSHIIKIYGSGYSRMDQAKIMEDSLYKFPQILLGPFLDTFTHRYLWRCSYSFFFAIFGHS